MCACTLDSSNAAGHNQVALKHEGRENVHEKIRLLLQKNKNPKPSLCFLLGVVDFFCLFVFSSLL